MFKTEIGSPTSLVVIVTVYFSEYQDIKYFHDRCKVLNNVNRSVIVTCNFCPLLVPYGLFFSLQLKSRKKG